jgi:CorA-like Mg2+ transporter protein
MASARTTYRHGQDGDGAAAAAHPFVWVSLRDPSPDELAAVQREFGLPAPLVDGLATAARRPVLELTGELLFAVVKTTTWVAAEEAVKLGEVQLVLGDSFVVSVDRDGAVLERVRQDLEDDPELVGAGVLVQSDGEAVKVQAHLVGVAEQVVGAKRVLMVEEVAHLPERSLVGGRLRLRGELRVGVDVVERQVPPHIGDVAELTEQLTDDRLRLAAVRALEIAVLGDRDRRINWPTDVVALRVDLDVQVDERLARSEQGADARAPRQQRRRPEQQPGEERGAEDAELRVLSSP